MKKNFMFTSESVTEGHPDKVCDQISDAIVDHFLAQDPYARVRAECAVSTSILFIAARFASEVKADIPTLARKVISQLGYRRPDFDPQTCSVLTSFQEYPPAADLYFNEGKLTDAEIENIPVRQQATMFGFACRQTEVLMPLPIWLAHKLSRRIIQVQKEKILPYLSPDAKTQVGVEYRGRQPHRIHSLTLVVSGSRSLDYQITPQRLHDDIRETVIRPAFAEEAIRPDAQTLIAINPIENLMVGGPAVHSGLTGRKNDVDTYGDYSRQSANALSGKDPLRIDRIGVYAARYAAKNVVAAGLAEECEVQLSYSIGFSRPVSVQVETFSTGKLPDNDLATLVERHFDFRLAGILRQFNLRHLPALHKGKFYQKLAAYGHVGRQDLNLPWEATDKVEVLQNS
ncbi:MAG: methionine adenosyltransferase [Thermodesulfobacteriota bacterium]